MANETTYWGGDAALEAVLLQLSDARRPTDDGDIASKKARDRLIEMGLAVRDAFPDDRRMLGSSPGTVLTVDGHHAQQDARLVRLERMIGALSEDVGGLMLSALAGDSGAADELRKRAEHTEARLSDAEAFTGDAEVRLAVIEHRLGIGRPGRLALLRERAAAALRALAGRVEARA